MNTKNNDFNSTEYLKKKISKKKKEVSKLEKEVNAKKKILKRSPPLKPFLIGFYLIKLSQIL